MHLRNEPIKALIGSYHQAASTSPTGTTRPGFSGRVDTAIDLLPCPRTVWLIRGISDPLALLDKHLDSAALAAEIEPLGTQTGTRRAHQAFMLWLIRAADRACPFSPRTLGVRLTVGSCSIRSIQSFMNDFPTPGPGPGRKLSYYPAGQGAWSFFF